MTSCTGSARGGFWRFRKSRRVENLTPNEKGRLSGLAEARRICALRAPHDMEWGKKECVSLSLCRRTFKLKGNKKFRTWTKKSLRVFRVSGFLYSMYICYEHSMYVWHIFMYGYVTESQAFHRRGVEFVYALTLCHIDTKHRRYFILNRILTISVLPSMKLIRN